MVQHGDFKAWIEVHGIALDEFAADPQEGRIIRWIPSEEGQNFSVHWQDLQPERDHAICGEIHLDGTHVRGKIRIAHAPWTTSNTSGKLVDAGLERPFTFCALDLTDEDSYLEGSTNAFTDLGAIEIRIWKVKVSGLIPFKVLPGVLPGENKIHEKSKKVGGHCVKLGEAKEILKPTTRSSNKLGSAPLVTFRFLYRPLDLLRANGIAPPAPAPSPSVGDKRTRSNTPDLAVKSEDEDDMDEQEAALRRQLAEIQAQRNSRRNKRVKVKTEPITHRGVFSSGEVIDLTLE